MNIPCIHHTNRSPQISTVRHHHTNNDPQTSLVIRPCQTPDLDFLVLTLWDIYTAVGRNGQASCALAVRAATPLNMSNEGRFSDSGRKSSEARGTSIASAEVDEGWDKSKSIVPFSVRKFLCVYVC